MIEEQSSENPITSGKLEKRDGSQTTDMYFVELNYEDIVDYQTEIESTSPGKSVGQSFEHDVFMQEAMQNLIHSEAQYTGLKTRSFQQEISVGDIVSNSWSSAEAATLDSRVRAAISGGLIENSIGSSDILLIDLFHNGTNSQLANKLYVDVSYVVPTVVLQDQNVYSWGNVTEIDCGSTNSPPDIETAVDQYVSNSGLTCYGQDDIVTLEYGVSSGRVTLQNVFTLPMSGLVFDESALSYPSPSATSPYIDEGQYMTHVATFNANLFEDRCFNGNKQFNFRDNAIALGNQLSPSFGNLNVDVYLALDRVTPRDKVSGPNGSTISTIKHHEHVFRYTAALVGVYDSNGEFLLCY